jgi:poly-gamma-glutamate synthesis protein (capsule biosynthesis protein)
MEALFAEAEVAGAPYRLVEGQEADLQIDMQKEPDGVLFAFRVYVPVARFATLRQGVTTEELKAIWSGQAATPLLVDEDAWASLRWLWGEPAAGAPVVSVRADALADRLWAEPEALGIVPFHRLEPRLKALALDGHLATDNALVLAEDGAPADYPLTIRIFAHGPAEAIERMRAALAERVVLADRDASRLTVLIMTGVTALTRATAAK